MRLICPHCMSTVTVPDDAAGKEAVCPNCGKAFSTPSRYSAAVVPGASAAAGALEPARTAPHPEPATPPGYVPPTPAPTPTPPPGYVPPAAGTGFLPAAGAPADATPAGYAHARGVTISPQVFSWLPAALLLFTLVLTFFPWVGVYKGSTSIYWEQPWRSLIGKPGRNFDLERAVALPTGWLNKVRSDWELMVPFLLCLLLATVLAWLDRAGHMFDPNRLKRLERIWPHRQAIIGVLAALAFTFSLIQVLNGFGMQRAIRQTVNEQFAGAREKAVGDPAEQSRIEFDEEAAYRGFNIERTTWLYLALLCNAFAVLALIVRYLLARRANKPPPRLVLHY